MMPTDLQAAAERYRAHLAACAESPDTALGSPYFEDSPNRCRVFNDKPMLADAGMLADAMAAELSTEPITPESLPQFGFYQTGQSSSWDHDDSRLRWFRDLGDGHWAFWGDNTHRIKTLGELRTRLRLAKGER